MKTRLLITVFALCAVAYGDSGGFTASLQDCTELIGLGPVPMSAVRPLAPANYFIIPFDTGVAGLVVRAAECQINVGGGPARPVRIAQIGVAIASPDGTGQINNYTLLYATNDSRLAGALQDLGLAVGLDPLLAYEFNSATGEVYVAVAPPGVPAYFLSGSASNPPSGGDPVTANWWAQTRRGTLKMATSIPAISYGFPTSTVLHTSRASLLGGIIGGNTDASFPFFNARGKFTSGTFSVAVR